MRNRVPIFVTLAAALVAGLTLASASSASTASPLTWATACVSDLDVATCERVTYLANRADDPPAPVVLDDNSANRLDLTWWGVWAAVGLLLALLIAPAWRAVFPWGKSGGAV